MKTRFCLALMLALFLVTRLQESSAQVMNELQHTRGRLWENIANDGWIGSLGCWDYLVYMPFGLFPGFKGFVHPVGNENLAIDAFANANMHNFRSGVWLVAKNVLEPGQPPTWSPTPKDYEIYTSGLQEDTYGGEQTRAPLVQTSNFLGSATYDPLLPEEMITGKWNTDLGVTVTRRSYVWSFPGYRDFIIYDYVFKNSGEIVSTITNSVVPDSVKPKFHQTLNPIYFVFHSGLSVSTKSQINFHSTLESVQAGAFGWLPAAYHDYYHIFDDGALVFSTNYNGGRRPPPFDTYPIKDSTQWLTRFGPELQSPAAYGWAALYASPTGTTPRTTPKPDVLRIDVHKGGTFRNQSLDLERFVTNKPKQDFYDFASTPDTQAALGNHGNRMNFYTLSYGPYKLAFGDSVRIIIAEIAGVMDMNEVLAGDLKRHFPDSTIAAIRRNADNARNAVKWGIGANVHGFPLAAAVMPPPPPPTCDAVNASFGTVKAAIAITWEKNAETAQISDGSGSIFYNGASDLDGYRIYKSTDFQYTPDNTLPIFRGEAWELLREIPFGDAVKYYDQSLAKYKFIDSSAVFGFRYGYYVSAFRKANPAKSWTAPNGTVVSGIPELASGSVNKTLPTSAAPGPVNSMDVFVAPNPYVYGDPERSFGTSNPYGIEFRNLPELCTIRIYTIMGDIVKTMEHKPDSRGNVYGSEPWDQKTDSGLLVAPGLYVYHIEPHVAEVSGSLTGKLMIIR